MDRAWRRQLDASDRLTGEMLRLASREFADDIEDAWADFNQQEIPAPLEKYPDERQIFSPYFLFEWDPDRPLRQRGSKPRVGLIAQSFVLKAWNRLSDLERMILEQATVQPVSFYDVVRCDPGERIVLRDILIGGETEVVERSASKVLRPGDIAYAQIWHLPEVATLGRLAPIPIPPSRKSEIVGLRAKMRKKITKQSRELAALDLVRNAEEIRATYLNIRDAMRMPPRFCNTDGDPLNFHTLKFRIGSAQAAFDALAPLAWGCTKEELLEDADLGEDGTLHSIEFAWAKGGNKKFETWDNTILGKLKISGQSLVAEVNSANRAAKLRQEVEQRLRMLAVHESTVAQTPEEMMKENGERKTSPRLGSDAERKALDLDPELRREAEMAMQWQVESWIYQKLSVLGGRTPADAVGDPDGKEIVEALLLDWERQGERAARSGQLRPDIGAVRRLLKLDLPVA